MASRERLISSMAPFTRPSRGVLSPYASSGWGGVRVAKKRAIVRSAQDYWGGSERVEIDLVDGALHPTIEGVPSTCKKGLGKIMG
jgi:hypothetical protein